MISIFPEDIRIEVLLEYLTEESYIIQLCGLHKRNACKDLIKTDGASNGRQILELARMSLYNSLPEYFFHPSDRFSQIRGREMRDIFLEEVRRQEMEKKEAVAFFSPIDLAILNLNKEVYEDVLPLVSDNMVLHNLLGDKLTEKQRENRFIQKTIRFLPEAKNIRGNQTMLTLLLRSIFKEERLSLVPLEGNRLMEDPSPRYEDSVGGTIGEVFAGNQYETSVVGFLVHYWSDEVCDESFLQFVEDLETYRLFVQDWFMSVEEEILFYIEDNSASTRLSDTLTNSYLNYNTNLN